MGKREQSSRLRRPTGKLQGPKFSEPVPKPKRKRRGVGPVHPNSAAARVWGRTSWEYRAG